MNRLLERETGERHHAVAIENLAQSLHRSAAGVHSLYMIILNHYNRTARNKYFLSALVTKRVRELVREEKLPSDLEGRRGHRSEL